MKTPPPRASADAIKVRHTQDLKSALVVHKETSAKNSHILARVQDHSTFLIFFFFFKAFNQERSKLVRFGRVSNFGIKEDVKNGKIHEYCNLWKECKIKQSKTGSALKKKKTVLVKSLSKNESSVIIHSPSTRFTRCNSSRYAVRVYMKHNKDFSRDFQQIKFIGIVHPKI